MDLENYFRFVLALVFVLGLIGMLAWLAKRFGMTPRITGSSREKRVSIVEIVPVDGKRRLILVRRDDTEHLIMMGGAGDILVESEIVPPKRAEPAASAPRSVAGGET